MLNQNLFLSTEPTGKYVYALNGVVYKVSSKLEDDDCDKYMFVKDTSDSNLTPIDGVTYVNAPKFEYVLSWDDAKLGHQAKIYTLYCDKVVTPGWKVDTTDGVKFILTVKDNFITKELCKKEDGTAVKITPEEYVYHSYLDDAITNLINGVSNTKVWSNLPYIFKYVNNNKIGIKTYTVKTAGHTPSNLGIVLDNTKKTLSYTTEFTKLIKSALEEDAKQYLIKSARKFGLTPQEITIETTY